MWRQYTQDPLSVGPPEEWGKLLFQPVGIKRTHVLAEFLFCQLTPQNARDMLDRMKSVLLAHEVLGQDPALRPVYVPELQYLSSVNQPTKKALLEKILKSLDIANIRKLVQACQLILDETDMEILDIQNNSSQVRLLNSHYFKNYFKIFCNVSFL